MIMKIDKKFHCCNMNIVLVEITWFVALHNFIEKRRTTYKENGMAVCCLKKAVFLPIFFVSIPSLFRRKEGKLN